MFFTVLSLRVCLQLLPVYGAIRQQTRPSSLRPASRDSAAAARPPGTAGEERRARRAGEAWTAALQDTRPRAGAGSGAERRPRLPAPQRCPRTLRRDPRPCLPGRHLGTAGTPRPPIGLCPAANQRALCCSRPGLSGVYDNAAGRAGRPLLPRVRDPDPAPGSCCPPGLGRSPGALGTQGCSSSSQ